MVHSLVHSHSVIDHNFADAFAGNCLRRETPWAHSGGQADPKTAKRVWKVIEKLRYYPNTQARALVSGRSRILGLIVSDITNPFFPELIKGFEDVAIQNGYEILVSSTNYDSARMALCVRRMLERKVEGVAIMTSEMDKNLLDQTREGLLMVRETVAVETRARRATSWIFITGRRGPIPGTRFTASKWYLIPRRASLKQA
jgi:hypothetical protein